MTTLSPAAQASVETLESLRSCIEQGQCFRLEAGAGAGKTYSLIESLKYVISLRANEFAISGKQVACITYTNVAKDEIKARTDNNPVIFADTIHAFSWSILQNYQEQLRQLIPTLGAKWQERIAESAGISHQTVKYDLGFASIKEQEISLHHDDVVALMARMLAFPKFQKLLKSKFPIIFIDEYQDTDSALAESIVQNLIDNDSGVMVGLFGDHWQKIYGSSACGLIRSPAGKIIEIGKRANFRSDKNIVECLNRMRPELPQAESDPSSTGTIKVYHSNDWQGMRQAGGHWKDDLPEEETRRFIQQTKSLMVEHGWDMSLSKTKILFLTNNLIATEQKFKNLADCFNYSEDYLKKNDKYIEFFVDTVELTALAFQQRKYGELLQIKKKNRSYLTSQADKTAWIENLEKLMRLRDTSTIGDVLDLLIATNVPRVPAKVSDSEARYQTLFVRDQESLAPDELRFVEKIRRLRAVPYFEVINLAEYINDKTPFSTKHGVKGAEFDNVLVVCGRGWNHYNWDQMLEWMEDGVPQRNAETFERNRNLFYVSCSRAKHNLTLLFTQRLTDKSLTALGKIFGHENIKGCPFKV
ncbi:UvrD-helicase domain-containing protein [Vibrio cholerae]|uniref:UvrD-helicase domain-containing protein n=1 Tax=Vibrio cholerae TaxID=666 RepID=UPI00084D0F78|nr:UvrD-helicase domain-containing protein [Vibrio cholerae]OEG76142.1 DNA helicase II [Vibrio cholerae]PAR83220.1 ATP-dependent helicase [Vibrio cholerae]